MANSQGQPNSLSDRIYHSIVGRQSQQQQQQRRPHSTRPMSARSASTTLSFPASPRHSTARTSQKTAFSDADIIKNRSWSASRIRSDSALNRSRGSRVNVPACQLTNRMSISQTDTRTPATPIPGSINAPGESKGRQLQPPKELWNLKGSQVDRLQQEWAAVAQCRAMKRASEMVQHRLNPMYRLSGSNMPLLARYQVKDTDLQRLKEMSETSRILQLDLKRVKYPQGGYYSPRRERPSRTKSHNSKRGPGPQNSLNGEERSGEGEGSEVPNAVTSPVPATQQPSEGKPHPSSPISTPEDTPRPVGGATTTTTADEDNQGETTQGDDDESQQFS